MTLWLYGWTTAAARALGRGAAGEALRALRLRPGVVAIAGEVPAPLQPSLAALKAQDKVVRRLFTRLGALAPARFGSAVEDVAALRRAMEGRWAALSRTLAELKGLDLVQMTARGFGRARRPARSSLPRTPGARYLAKAAWRVSVPELAEVRADYGRFVRRELLERGGAPPLAWTAHHLVTRRAVRAYRSAIRRAGARAGFEVSVTGPHPPYAFVAEI